MLVRLGRLKIPANDYLTKPVDPDLLVAMVERVVTGR